MFPYVAEVLVVAASVLCVLGLIALFSPHDRGLPVSIVCGLTCLVLIAVATAVGG